MLLFFLLLFPCHFSDYVREEAWVDLQNPNGHSCDGDDDDDPCDLSDTSGATWNWDTASFQGKVEIEGDDSSLCVKLMDETSVLREEECHDQKVAVCQLACGEW